MHISLLRIVGLRAFEDTGDIHLSPRINIFIGQNNAGKSTILKVPMALQGYPFTAQDHRANSVYHYFRLQMTDVSMAAEMINRSRPPGNYDIIRDITAPDIDTPNNFIRLQLGDDGPVFSNQRPKHAFEIFLARRKAIGFDQNVNSGTTNIVTGNLHNLYARINHLDASGHPNHHEYAEAVKEIVGVPITMHSAPNGLEAGFYMDPNNFVSLERMGDGVSEMMALIVELSLARDKIFILEEPETNLHPRGLKALMAMVRKSSERNQFLIATHSNVVVRELGSESTTSVFRVFREDDDYRKPSSVVKVPAEPLAHAAVMRDLGYEFGDLNLHDGWLFLEESSAEQILDQVLIPLFVPELRGKLRTFSAGGASNLPECVAEFHRLITFVHLQPAYRGRLWIWADGDKTGQEAVGAIHDKFDYLDEEHCSALSAPHFEDYFPDQFRDQAAEALSLSKKEERRSAKLALLKDALAWTKEHGDIAKETWAASAAEVIERLRGIAALI